MSVVISGRTIRPDNVEPHHLSFVEGRLNRYLNVLRETDTDAAKDRLVVAESVLASANLPPRLGSLATGRQSHALAMVQRLEILNDAWLAARGKLTMPHLQPEERQELKKETIKKYQVSFYEEGGLRVNFRMPQGMNYFSACNEVNDVCCNIRRDYTPVNYENIKWLERNQEKMGERSGEGFSLGYRFKEGDRKSSAEQALVLAKQGLELPAREVALLGHSLAYLNSGTSIFNGYPIRTSDGNGLRFSDQGLAFEFGHKLDMFSICLGMRRD